MRSNLGSVGWVVMSTSRLHHGLDAEFLQAIGLVCIHWSGLETLVDGVIARLLSISPDESHAILTGI